MIDLTEEIMKKITTILLALLLAFAMAGCTGGRYQPDQPDLFVD